MGKMWKEGTERRYWLRTENGNHRKKISGNFSVHLTVPSFFQHEVLWDKVRKPGTEVTVIQNYGIFP